MKIIVNKDGSITVDGTGCIIVSTNSDGFVVEYLGDVIPVNQVNVSVVKIPEAKNTTWLDAGFFVTLPDFKPL